MIQPKNEPDDGEPCVAGAISVLKEEIPFEQEQEATTSSGVSTHSSNQLLTPSSPRTVPKILRRARRSRVYIKSTSTRVGQSVGNLTKQCPSESQTPSAHPINIRCQSPIDRAYSRSPHIVIDIDNINLNNNNIHLNHNITNSFSKHNDNGLPNPDNHNNPSSWLKRTSILRRAKPRNPVTTEISSNSAKLHDSSGDNSEQYLIDGSRTTSLTITSSTTTSSQVGSRKRKINLASVAIMPTSIQSIPPRNLQPKLRHLAPKSSLDVKPSSFIQPKLLVLAQKPTERETLKKAIKTTFVGPNAIAVSGDNVDNLIPTVVNPIKANPIPTNRNKRSSDNRPGPSRSPPDLLKKKPRGRPRVHREPVIYPEIHAQKLLDICRPTTTSISGTGSPLVLVGDRPKVATIAPRPVPRVANTAVSLQIVAGRRLDGVGCQSRLEPTLTSDDEFDGWADDALALYVKIFELFADNHLNIVKTYDDTRPVNTVRFDVKVPSHKINQWVTSFGHLTSTQWELADIWGKVPFGLGTSEMKSCVYKCKCAKCPAVLYFGLPNVLIGINHVMVVGSHDHRTIAPGDVSLTDDHKSSVPSDMRDNPCPIDSTYEEEEHKFSTINVNSSVVSNDTRVYGGIAVKEEVICSNDT